MLNLRQFLVVIVLLLQLSAQQNSIDDAPRLISENGNLIFQTSSTKSINFQTQNGGEIRLNNIDLKALSDEIRSMQSTVNQIRDLRNCNCELINTRLDTYSGKIESLESSLATSNGRITVLENDLRNIKEIASYDDCANHPCHNGAQCIDGYNSFKCICPPNFTGRHCTEDVNECQQITGTIHGCQNNARCENTIGSFKCICTGKWSGVLCNIPISSCSNASSVEICGHGTCFPDHSPNNPRPFKCLCDSGWSLDPVTQTCINDIDECRVGKYPCSTHPYVACINTPGNVRCEDCPSGFDGNGFGCVDINECANANTCGTNEDCINSFGSYQCNCIQGMKRGVNGICQPENICESNNGGCNINAVCTANNFILEGRVCTCSAGYIGNGVGSNGCRLETPSNNTNRDYRRCVRRQLCRNEGTCVLLSSGFKCRCLPGFTGSRCRTIINNQCLSNPCLNGGQCEFLSPNHYRCHCLPLFTGINCQNEHTECGGTYITSNDEQEIGLFTSLSSQASGRSFRFPCIWTIIAQNDQFFQIVPITLQLIGICTEEFVQLTERSTIDETTNEIGKYCQQSNISSQSYNTTGHILIIKAQLKKNIQRNHGFRLKVIPTNIPLSNLQCCKCSNYLTTRTRLTIGLFQSPHFPLSYPTNTRCFMEFEREYGERYRMELQIKTLDLGNRISNCSDSDYLKIHFIESGEVKMTACNQHLFYNKIFITSGFSVQFRSDRVIDTNSTRFQIRWKKSLLQDPCGGLVPMNPIGILQGPSIAADDEALCTWKIQHTNTSRLLEIKGLFENWVDGDCSVKLSIIKISNSGRNEIIWQTCQTQMMLRKLHEQINGDLIVQFIKYKGVSTQPFKITFEYICGQSMNMDKVSEYEFQSENYPDNYDNNLNCIYKFSAKTRKIAIAFSDVDINDEYPCNNDYIKIIGSNRYRDNKYCNGNKNDLSTVMMSEEYIYVVFQTNSSISGQGFKAKVTVFECGGYYYFRNKLMLGYPEGHLNETIYHLDHQYERNKNCTWEITAPNGNMIFYIFDHFHLEPHIRCRFDYLELKYDNRTKRFCGNMAENSHTNGNKLKIKFISDGSLAGEGFVLRLYSTSASNYCHKTIEASEGVIMSPSTQFLTRPYMCVYSIKVPQFKKVVLNITINNGVRSNDTINFGLPCFGNTKLKIINGAFGSSHMVDLCPAYPPTEEFRTSSNFATIIYLVPNYQSALEFNYTINFYSSDDECGSILTSNYGVISSPGYPLYAAVNSYCRWEIQTKPGKRLRILITHIRAGSVRDTQQCNEKTPVIRLISMKKEINIACSDHLSTDYVFEEPKVNIVFQNFLKTNYRFKILYNQFCVYTTNALSGRIESSNIMSMGRSYCEWTLTSLRGSSINIYIDVFDLPRAQDGNCLAFVKISDKNGNIMDKTCGNELLNRTFASSNFPIKIKHFVSSNISPEILRAHQGLVIEYQTQGCYETINYDPDQDDYSMKSGILQSSKYPNSVSNIDCIWILKSIPGYSVKFKFDVIEMDSFPNCTEDPILTVWDNEMIEGNHIFQSCSRIDNGKPIEFQSSTHEVYLKFFSAKDANGGQRKFHGYYEFVNSSCEFKMSGSEGIIQSPNYPNPYPHELRCKWNLQVREGMSIHLRFLDFETENSLCTYDYVELFSTINDEMVKLKRLCGRPVNISSTIFDSLSNQMTVTFRSDYIVRHKGFKAKYFEACGGVRMATGSNQFLLSPNYPHAYSLTDGICEWNIVANTTQIGVRIFFYFLGFEGGSNNPNCSQENSLTIIEGLESNSPVKAVLCTKYAYHPIISNGHYLKIVLRSTTGNAIFKAAYGTGSSTCGGDFYLDDGLITSPFYPDAVNMDLDCIYIIRSSPGSFIDVTFEDFSRHGSYYLHDFIEIRDGPFSNSSLIGRFYHLEDLRNLTNNFKFYNSVWMRLRSQGGNFTNDIKFMARYHINYVTEFRSDKGSLASPQFGHVYSQDTDISWTINGETSDILLISFDQFSVGRILINGECSRGRLTITDSNNNVKVLCGSSIIPPGKYSTPIIIRLSAEGYRYQGFLLQWSIPSNETHTKIGECKYIIKASKNKQLLTSPNYPDFDPNIRSCQWTIISEENSAIEIQMLNFTLEDSTNCKYENFTVVFQRTIKVLFSNEAFFVRYRRIFCGSPNLSTFNFFNKYRFNKIEITFKTDEADYFPGFRLSYKLACHKRISNPIEGWLQNDEYPNPITEDKNCSYELKFMYNRKIILNVTKLNLPPKTNGQCEDGYLLISAYRINEKYCGSVVPPNLNMFMTNSSSVLIKLVGNFSRLLSTFSGFQLMYMFEETGDCGGNHQLTRIGESRIVQIENANLLQSFIECKWTFTSPYGSRMQIDFELMKFTDDCNTTFVALYEGRTILSEKIGGKNYCYKRNSLFTSGNNLMVLYKNWNVYTSFRLKISLSECGGLFVRSKGVISSPNFPLNYPQRTNCIWRIKGTRQITIKLKFLERELDQNCSKSNITIISVENQENILTWNNCQNSSYYIKIENSEIIIMFSTNTIITRKGFKLQYQFTRYVCGGTLKDPSKELKSINFPRSIPFQQTCEWTIVVDVSKKIVINIKKLTITAGCLQIGNHEARYRYMICHRNLENFEIDTNLYYVRIYLKNFGESSIHFSYHSNLPSLCGSHIYPTINSTGHILIENINISLCTHIFHNYPEDEGTISFKKVSLRGLNCSYYDYILRSQISMDKNGPLWDFGSACQLKNTKTSFVTFGKKIEFFFTFPRASNISNYKVDLFYKYHKCGKLLVKPFGHIQSPGYPNKYPNNANCEWLIKAPNNMQIQLTIRTLHLEHHQTCDYDYLYIRYGAEFNSPPFRKFCGRNPIDNETLIFHNNQLRISFHSDYSVMKDGFYFEYSFINPVDNCNGIIFNTAGSIKSPNYPRPYPSNLRCNWTVAIPFGYRVSLTFKIPFDLERAVHNKCVFDSLKIFDSNATILLADLCGNTPPSKPIVSSTNKMTLLFSTDFNHNLDGFHAQYKSICGGHFDEIFGEIQSPVEFIGYTSPLKCEYMITEWENHLTVLRIASNLIGCYHSQIEIFLETRNGQFVLNRKFCDTISEIKILHGKSIKIIYTTTRYGMLKSRFRASYIHDENVKVLRNVTRPYPVRSPHFPTPYHHNANLTWKLYAPVGYIFYVKIKSVDIEPSGIGCSYDFVSFSTENSTVNSTENSTSSPSIFCGNQTDFVPFRIDSNSLIIKFQSDISHYENHTGFDSIILPTPGPSLGCGGYINVTEGISGVISSVDLDNNGKYENNLMCEWQLQTEIGRAIQLTFENNSVNMEKRSRGDCRFDSLKIFDGPDSVRPLLQTLCGNDQTDPITSQSNAMLIYFITDSSINGKGFKLSYTSIASLNHVVRIATNYSQIMQSPDYPNDSPYDSRFMGEISSSNEFDHVLVTITDLKLRSTANCSLDKFRIQDVSLKYLNKIRIFCKPLLSPYVFISSHNKLIVQYMIGPMENPNLSSNKRFQIDYKLYSCNRTEQAYSGTLVNIENLKQARYSHNLYCNLTLIAPVENLRYQFYFKRFYLERSPTCSYDYVRFIFGGPNEPQYTLPKLCGSSLPASFISNSSRVTIIFATDYSVNHDGYEITYVINKDPLIKCGGELEIDSGVITSPGFGQNYYESGECTWRITMMSNSRIKWKFTDLQLGNSTNFDTTCYSDTDFVQVLYNGQISKYCGYMVSGEEFYSSSPTMVVKYKSINGGTGAGFRLIWEAAKIF